MGLLEHRLDSFAWQDQTALQIVEDVFKNYPQANFELQVSEPLRVRSLCIQYRETDLAFVQRLLAEEGLSYHFRHLQGDAAAQANDAGQARHVMVITDRAAPRASLGELRFAAQHATANLRSQKDAVTAFMAQRSLTANAVARVSWNYKHLSGTGATVASALDLGDVPALEVYDGSGAYRYQDEAHAERAAELALAALELGAKRFEGQGSARHLMPGAEFTLVDHPLYGANTSAFNYAGALLASRQRPDYAFVVLAVEHHASNNLGVQPALVVGPAGQPITTERDLRVKIPFPWPIQPSASHTEIRTPPLHWPTLDTFSTARPITQAAAPLPICAPSLKVCQPISIQSMRRFTMAKKKSRGRSTSERSPCVLDMATCQV